MQTHRTKFVCSVEHTECRAPARVAMQRDLEGRRDPTFNLEGFEFLNSLTRTLYLSYPLSTIPHKSM
jgi:hypothetical protein